MLRGLVLNGPRVLAALFVVYAVVAVTIMTTLVPPFCNADEAAHFMRADQLASGGVVATWPGGIVDLGIEEVAGRFDTVRGHPEVKVSRAMLDGAAQIRWGRRGGVGFPNTALYPPTGYVPAAAVILAGLHFGWPIAATLNGARLISGAVCIAVCAAAIALSGGMAAFVFTILCLPMSLGLFAAVSQDGVLIAASALAVALVGRRARGREAWVLCACLVIAAMGRPPYLALVALVLTLGAQGSAGGWRKRLGAASGIAGMVLAWGFWCARPIAAVTLRGAGVNPAKQVASLLGHPALLWQVPIVVVAHQWADGLPYARQFVGVLGWLDVSLPGVYIAAAWAMIGLALVLARPAASSTRTRVIVAAAILVSCAGIFAGQYLTWTAVGSHLVEGVQGRYFLPLALFVPLMLPARRAALERMRMAYVAVMAFPAMSIAVTVHALLQRYYF